MKRKRREGRAAGARDECVGSLGLGRKMMKGVSKKESWNLHKRLQYSCNAFSDWCTVDTTSERRARGVAPTVSRSSRAQRPGCHAPAFPCRATCSRTCSRARARLCVCCRTPVRTRTFPPSTLRAHREQRAMTKWIYGNVRPHDNESQVRARGHWRRL